MAPYVDELPDEEVVPSTRGPGVYIERVVSFGILSDKGNR
jgi:hypothetical protein